MITSYLLIATFVIACLILLGWGLLNRGRIYEFPFLAAAVFLGWVLPQLFGLAQDRYLPPGAFEKMMLMTILCVAMVLMGRLAARRPLEVLGWTYDANRLLWASAILSLAGGYFFMKISRLPEHVQNQTQASGILVAYLFLAEMLAYGYVIAIIVFLRTWSFRALFIVLFCSAFYFDRIIIAGRRAALLDFVFAILLAFWFQRRIVLPRSLMVASLVLGSIGIHSIGAYRGISTSEDGPSWERISQIDTVETLERLIADGGNEMRNAVYAIYAADITLKFDFGLWHWNTLVFNFVPAQIVGRSIKDSLYIHYDDSINHITYVPDVGSTWTGVADSFRSFWYFGALKFFLIALIMGKLYRAAMAGQATAQILYILLMGAALHAITHHTQRFLSAMVQLAILLFPLLYVCRLPRGPAVRPAGEAAAGPTARRARIAAGVVQP